MVASAGSCGSDWGYWKVAARWIQKIQEMSHPITDGSLDASASTLSTCSYFLSALRLYIAIQLMRRLEVPSLITRETTL